MISHVDGDVVFFVFFHLGDCSRELLEGSADPQTVRLVGVVNVWCFPSVTWDFLKLSIFTPFWGVQSPKIAIFCDFWTLDPQKKG